MLVVLVESLDFVAFMVDSLCCDVYVIDGDIIMFDHNHIMGSTLIMA